MVDTNAYRRGKKTLLVYMSEDLHTELQDYAKKEEKTMNGVVREAVKKYLAARRSKKKRRK